MPMPPRSRRARASVSPEGPPDDRPPELDAEARERRAAALRTDPHVRRSGAEVARLGDRPLRPRARARGRADGRDHARRDGRRPRRHPARRHAPAAGLPGRARRARRPRSPTRELEWLSDEVATAEEGCLSLPGSRVDVERPLYARVRGVDVHGEPLLLEASGLEARVLQHEIDHLDGVLILDRTDARAAQGGAARAPRGRQPTRRAPTRRPTRCETVYLGTSDFAAAVLAAPRGLARTGPPLVVTPPDRAAGARAPVGAAAGRRRGAELGLELHSDRGRRTATTPLARIRAADARAGRRLRVRPADPRAAARRAAMLNVHPSLLPRWRGAAPIERAIMAGDRETGVTIIRVTAGLDSGPVALAARRCRSRRGDDFGSLAEPPRGARRGADRPRPRRWPPRDELEFVEQDESEATYAEKIGPAERRLDPSRPAIELERAVRALNPHLGCYLELEGGERLGVRAAGGRELRRGWSRAGSRPRTGPCGWAVARGAAARPGAARGRAPDGRRRLSSRPSGPGARGAEVPKHRRPWGLRSRPLGSVPGRRGAARTPGLSRAAGSPGCARPSSRAGTAASTACGATSSPRSARTAGRTRRSSA